MNEQNIPRHVAIILDGNGRWATSRGLTRSEGHQAGFNNLKGISEYIIIKRGVKVLSVFAFSTENFKREKKEVDFLMNLFTKDFRESITFFNEHDIKVLISGRRENLSSKVLRTIDDLQEQTKNNQAGILNICLNYGGQAEIVDTAKKIATMVENKEITVDDIDENLFSKMLYHDLPPIDLMIRTSGEQRISNFLLWQIAYAEFYFTDVHWPDFKENELEKALESFLNRNRRFGGNYENKNN